MIPTAYLRVLHINVGDERGTLQQLWAPTLGEDTHFYSQQYLEANGGEWRDAPHVYALITREQVGGVAAGQLHNDSASATNSPQEQK